MTNNEKHRWRSKETVAIYYMGLVGLEIKYADYDYAIYVYTGDNSVHKSKVYHGIRTSYFMFGRHRVSFNECISLI